MRVWGKVTLGLVLAVSLAGSIRVMQIASHNADMLIHRGPSIPEDTPADYGLAYQDVKLRTEDGLRLAAWYVPSQNGAAILAQHGYHNTRAEMLNEAEMLARHGYGVLLVDARAHGYSEGDLISFGRSEILDVRAALDFAASRPEIDPARIGALGNSQGAVTLLLATAEYPEIKAYAGNSPYASLQDEIATGVRSLTGLNPFPFAPLIQFFAERESRFRATEIAPIAYITDISPRPILLMQGGRDSVIPTDSGQRLFDAAGEPKQLWFEPGLEHVEFDTVMAKEFERRVVEFFDRYLLDQ